MKVRAMANLVYRSIRKMRRPGQSLISGFTPQILESVNTDKLITDVSRIFKLERKDVESKLQSYRAFHEAEGYSGRFGERKTLCFEEAFAICAALESFRPRIIVEIGTQYGRSTRRIIDINNWINLGSPIVCFDIVDEVRYFTPNEAKLNLKDVTYTFRQDVLETYESGFIYLDAHPYYLLRNVISGVLNDPRGWVVAIHDCSKGLCNPRMWLSKDDPNITSKTGHWERHVLGEILGIADPLSKELDSLEAATYQLDILETPHGLALIRSKARLECNDRL